RSRSDRDLRAQVARGRRQERARRARRAVHRAGEGDGARDQDASHGARDLKKSGGLLREGEHVKFAFIRAEKAQYPVVVLCRVLGVSRSGFHAWLRRPPSKRACNDAVLGAEIAEVHATSRRTYGSPRVHAELRARGRRVGAKRVARLMREKGLQSKRRRRFKATTDSKHALPVAPNLLPPNFTAEAPNKVWVGAITFVWTREGWLYLAVLIDLFSRAVVGWATSDRIDRTLALDALEMARGRRDVEADLVEHTDRGSQYAST